ncbi:MAG: 30S ribosomal protein S13 [Candidatus Cloacimonetes bacterium]|nr:30S ribosomal protein S13 [Candidatus Cloacimonadota bacterium]MBT6993543.1 30S ribosomal protein S13 [Candidatus Cloacimonadota bacterium]
MAHIAGVDIPKKKRVVIGLTYIFGIGKSLSQEILKKANVDENTKVQDLTDEEEKMLRAIIQDDYEVEGDLRTKRTLDIKRLMEIGCYRGIRHKKGMPVRGQRTHTNAKTRRGRKKK